ncbi:MAG: GAF domain-containing protein [Bacteroidales bacterium]
MKLKMKLRVKMLLWVLAVAIIIFLASIGYLTNRLEKITLRNAYNFVDATARENANSIQGNFNNEMGMARSMTQGFHFYKHLSQNELKETSKRILNGIAIHNPQFLSVWVSWELSAIDKDWDKSYGRERYTYYWENNQLQFVTDRKNETGDDVNSSYYNLKVSKQEAIVDPYWFTYTGSNKRVLETSICVPLINEDKFVGLFGFDIELARYQDYIANIKPYAGSFAMLLSQNGTIVAHTNAEYIGASVDSIYVNESKANGILEKLNSGKNFSISYTDTISGQDYYATFVAFNVGSSKNPWTLAIVAPQNIVMKEAQDVVANSRTVVFIGLIVLAIVVWIISYRITRPLVKTTNVLKELANGHIDLSKKINIKSGDEIQDIGNSVNILIDSLYKTTNFAKEIGKGNLGVSFNKLSESDVLGEALLEMRKSLEYAKALNDERKLEEEKVRWANEGVAMFADILRQNTDNMAEFTYDVIHNLVKYVNANIGGLFLMNTENNDKYFELASSFAYERRKYDEKRINYGEGLVGRCAKEGETIYMTELPMDYIRIASGMGDENPSSLLIVPLKLNDEVYGVIEIASFEPIEDYMIKFVEKIGESIAATISNVKVSIRTAKLLDESRIKSEELASQEEEMRQNMEELQATQEEAARKTAEMESLINALNSSSFVIEYDTNGKIISVNQAYLAITGQPEKEVIGTHHSDNLEFTEEQKQNYQKFWNDLRNGIIKKETNKINIGGKTYTFIETYSPILNESRQVIKILKIAHNVTDFIDKSSKKSKKE